MEKATSGVLIVILDTQPDASSARIFSQLCTYLNAHDTGIALIAGVNEAVTQPYLRTPLLPIYNADEFLNYHALDSIIIQHFAHIFIVETGQITYTHTRPLAWPLAHTHAATQLEMIGHSVSYTQQ